LAGRYAYRGFRPELSRATEGLALRVSSRARLPIGAAGRDAWISSTAIALGQGSHTVCHQAAASHLARQCAAACEARSVSSPDSEYLVSAHDGSLRADAAGHDRAVLHGHLADGAHRSAAQRCIVLVDFSLLRGGPSRALP